VQRKLASLAVSLRESVDRMLAAMNADRPSLDSQKQAEHRVIQRYHVARVWKQLALGLERGVQDHRPDWNRTKPEELPASWAIPVPGRPTPEDFIKAKPAGKALSRKKVGGCSGEGRWSGPDRFWSIHHSCGAVVW
jgi:hypothetical protein